MHYLKMNNTVFIDCVFDQIMAAVGHVKAVGRLKQFCGIFKIVTVIVTSVQEAVL